jgi:hypothetical protein
MTMHDYETELASRLFGVYLNTEWPEVFGTVDAALAAYVVDADDASLGTAIEELTAILAFDDDGVRARLHTLGLEYVFPDAAAARPFAEHMRTRLQAARAR